MNPTKFTIAFLPKNRPPEYIAELLACGESDGTTLIVDRDGDCFRALWAKYETARDPYAALRAAGPPGAPDWAKLGPALWRELHHRPGAAAEPPDAAAETRWLKSFSRRLPCGDCAAHWTAMLQRTPPDFSSRLAYFDWTWERHQEVNRRLPKIGIELADARKMYGYHMPILNRLKNHSVFTVAPNEDGGFEFCEAADNFSCVTLSRDELLRLADELVLLAHEPLADARNLYGHGTH